MRDPDGKLETYKEEIEFCIRRLKQFSKNEDKEIFTRWYNTLSTFPQVIEYMLFRYGRGDPLADIWSYFEKDGWPFYQRVVVHAKQLPPLSPDKDQERPSIGLFIREHSARRVNFFLTFLLCMDESPERIMNHRNWLFMDPPCPLVDVMLKSFIPNHRGVPNYKYNKYRQWWTFPLVNALAQPPEQRSAALAAHMNNWYRLMRPLGWEPTNAREHYYIFCDFAFEV
ncbi:DUF1911 domain-containing protein, partial [Verminephrobacter sp. Larva24]